MKFSGLCRMCCETHIPKRANRWYKEEMSATGEIHARSVNLTQTGSIIGEKQAFLTANWAWHRSSLPFSCEDGDDSAGSRTWPGLSRETPK